jgi:hypothetical protein
MLDGKFPVYLHAVGQFMGEMLLETVNPLYLQHLGLKPEGCGKDPKAIAYVRAMSFREPTASSRPIRFPGPTFCDPVSYPSLYLVLQPTDRPRADLDWPRETILGLKLVDK